MENLLLGVAPPVLVDALVKGGLDRAEARAVVETEARDPYLQGCVWLVAMQRKLHGLLDVYKALYVESGEGKRVPWRKALSPEEFFARYYFRNRPVAIRDGGAAWPAWRRLATDRWTPSGRVREALARGAVLKGRPFTALRQALKPLPPYVTDAALPSAWLEAPGPMSPLRRAEVNVLTCQVLGHRRIELIPSFELHRIPEGGVPPAPHFPEDADAEQMIVLDVRLSPGDMLFVPVGWWLRSSCLEESLSVRFEAFAAAEPNVRWRLPRAHVGAPRFRATHSNSRI